MNRLEELLAAAEAAKKAAASELLRLYPTGSEVRFFIMHGQRNASTGTVYGVGHDAGYLRVKHHEAKPRSRYAVREVHHTQVLGRPMAEATTDRAAILVATPEALAELLQLPEGSHLDAVWAPHDQPGVLHLRIRGAGWHHLRGQYLVRTVGTVTRQPAADGTPGPAVVDWGLPGASLGPRCTCLANQLGPYYCEVHAA